jgi:hypothetical protein
MVSLRIANLPRTSSFHQMGLPAFSGGASRTNSPADGELPMLEALKTLQGLSVHLPKRPKDYPDRERLSAGFERFRAAY